MGTLENNTKALLSRYGSKNFSLRVVTSTGIDPTNPSKGPTVTIVDIPIVAAKTTQYHLGQMAGGLVKENDINLIVDPTNLGTPKTGDKVIHSDGRIWDIMNVRPYSVGDSAFLYSFQIRA